MWTVESNQINYQSTHLTDVHFAAVFSFHVALDFAWWNNINLAQACMKRYVCCWTNHFIWWFKSRWISMKCRNIKPSTLFPSRICPPTMHFSVSSSIFIQANNSLTPKYCLHKSHHASIFSRCGFAWCCNWSYDLFISLNIHNIVSACRRLIQGKIHAFDRSLIKLFDTK